MDNRFRWRSSMHPFDDMQKIIPSLACIAFILLLASCIQVDYKAETLEPNNMSWHTGDVELFFKVKSRELEREFTDDLHKTRIGFPPNFAFLFCAPESHNKMAIKILNLDIQDSNGTYLYQLKEEKELILGMDCLQDYEGFEGLRMYSFKPGQASSAQGIHTTGWIPGFKAKGKYNVSITYELPNGDEVEQSIDLAGTLIEDEHEMNRLLFEATY
jgi:hypothetical protein